MGFELQTLKVEDFSVRQSRHTKLSHKQNTSDVFIGLYNHYLPKISELKNQVLKLRFKI